jgi:hypothetical protein
MALASPRWNLREPTRCSIPWLLVGGSKVHEAIGPSEDTRFSHVALSFSGGSAAFMRSSKRANAAA